MLNYVDLRSIAIYINEHYNEEHISEIITIYYSNKQNKTWADSFFQVTYQCLRIINLDHLLLDKVLEETEYIIDTVEQTDKPVMTDEIFRTMLNEFSSDLNLYELISNSLLVYSQNQDHCMIGGKKKRRMKRVMKGGLTGIPFIDFFIMAAEAVEVAGAAVAAVGSAVGALALGVGAVGLGFLFLLVCAKFLEIAGFWTPSAPPPPRIEAAVAKSITPPRIEAAAVAPSPPKLQEQAVCIMCMTNPPTHAFIPCGHKQLCGECAANADIIRALAKKCPICRGQFQSIVQIFDGGKHR